MADRRLAGTAFVTVDGVNYMLSGELSWGVATLKRESLTGMDRVHGFKETPQAGFIAGTFRDSGGLSIAAFNQMTDVTVVVELANGKTVVGRNMWTVEAQEVKSADGTVDVRWESDQVEEF